MKNLLFFALNNNRIFNSSDSLFLKKNNLQVPGRMGMIVTLYLISTNVYNAIKAPKGRGFSYTELWFIGSQFPILLALCEYGFVLYWKKIEKKVQQTRKSIRKKIQSAPKLR